MGHILRTFDHRFTDGAPSVVQWQSACRIWQQQCRFAKYLSPCRMEHMAVGHLVGIGDWRALSQYNPRAAVACRHHWVGHDGGWHNFVSNARTASTDICWTLRNGKLCSSYFNRHNRRLCWLCVTCMLLHCSVRGNKAGCGKLYRRQAT